MNDNNKPDAYRSKLLRTARAKNQTVMLTPEIAAQVRAATRGEDIGRDEKQVDESGVQRPGGIDGAQENPWDMTPVSRSENEGRFGRDTTPRVFQKEDQDSYEEWGKGARYDNNAPPSPFLDQEDEVFSRPSISQSATIQEPRREEPKNKGPESRDKDNKKTKAPQEIMEDKMSTIKAHGLGDQTRIAGFMVSYDVDPNGEVCELRKGRWMLTSRVTNEGNSIVLDDPSISQLHAIVRVTNDCKIQVLDQLSEYGTGVLRVGNEEEEEVVGAMVNLDHGDRVRFGKRYFYVCVIPSME